MTDAVAGPRALGESSRQLLGDREIALYASVRHDQVSMRMRGYEMEKIKRPNDLTNEPMLFGQYVGEALEIHARRSEEPRKILLLTEDEAGKTAIHTYGAIVYELDGFMHSLGNYLNASSASTPRVTDLRPEPVQLDDNDLCAIVVGEFTYEYEGDNSYTELESQRAALLVGMMSALRSASIPSELLVGTERSG